MLSTYSKKEHPLLSLLVRCLLLQILYECIVSSHAYNIIGFTLNASHNNLWKHLKGSVLEGLKFEDKTINKEILIMV